MTAHPFPGFQGAPEKNVSKQLMTLNMGPFDMGLKDRQAKYQEIERIRGRSLIVYVTSSRQNADTNHVKASSTNASSGLPQDSSGLREAGISWPVSVRERYEWHQPPQFPLQFQPDVIGEGRSFPPSENWPTERWLIPRKTA